MSTSKNPGDKRDPALPKDPRLAFGKTPFQVLGHNPNHYRPAGTNMWEYNPPGSAAIRYYVVYEPERRAYTVSHQIDVGSAISVAYNFTHQPGGPHVCTEVALAVNDGKKVKTLFWAADSNGDAKADEITGQPYVVSEYVPLGAATPDLTWATGIHLIEKPTRQTEWCYNGFANGGHVKYGPLHRLSTGVGTNIALIKPQYRQ